MEISDNNKSYYDCNKDLKTARGSFTFYGHGSTSDINLGQKPRVVVLYGCHSDDNWPLMQFQIYDSTSNFKYRYMYNSVDKLQNGYSSDIKIKDNGFSYTQNLGSSDDTIFLGTTMYYYVIF